MIFCKPTLPSAVALQKHLRYNETEKQVRFYIRKGNAMKLNTVEEIKGQLKYLQLLSKKYPNIQRASSEIIRLQAILNLPKGTEHFMSDLHGEYEAFIHIRNSASGAIREKVDVLFANTLSSKERAALATLIYYPEEKLEERAAIEGEEADLTEWYRITLNRLIEVCRLLASKYTRNQVRTALPEDYAYVLDELLYNSYDERNKGSYYSHIISTILDLDRAPSFIIALCTVIKRLIVDRLHIVGDIFDRGPRADIVMDCLMAHHAVDIQWGNHDVLWMGAASGSRTCIAAVLNNCLTYNNLEVVEAGYGISLRPLALFANEKYQNCDISCFLPKSDSRVGYKPKDIQLAARMHKAIAIILFKLEGQIIRRNPFFHMEDRLLLDKIDYDNKCVRIGQQSYPMSDCDFPTVDRENPFELSEEERELMRQLKLAFTSSERLQRHVRFLYSRGGMYCCYNQNLLFHGCIPLKEDGTLLEFEVGGKRLCGRAFMDYAESMARQGYYGQEASAQKQAGKDFLWYLWCGKNSPLFGRDKIATFERLLVKDKATWAERKNPYYRWIEEESTCLFILRHFGLGGPYSHIINGHVPVRSKDGENPVKANGRLIVIDGGFCRAYQPTTGIAGYTLIYNSYGLKLSSHEPFDGKANAIKKNKDILSTQVVFERASDRIQVKETDEGARMLAEIADLHLLLSAYQLGLLQEWHEEAQD